MDHVALGARHWLILGVLAALMEALWLRSGGAAVMAGLLPDTDDMLRLVQVRDWLGGQAFGDLRPHRLGSDDWAMHWSRLGDFGIAAWIVVLRPVFGSAMAETGAVVAWPLTLFIAYLSLSARLAMRMSGRDAAWPALIVAAFAFPAITMFVPGRIDHHGLQIILLLVAVDAVLVRREPTGKAAVLLGLAIAASLAIGVETAPHLLVLLGVAGFVWMRGGERKPLVILGATLALATLTWLLVVQPAYWPPDVCDGFSRATVAATVGCGASLALLGLATPGLPDWRWRLGAASMIALVAIMLVWTFIQPCLSGPYGAVDPLLARLWLSRVEEARPLLEHGVAVVLGFGGLPLAGLLACGWLARREVRWLPMLAVQSVAVAVMLVQVRGAAPAAALAIPALVQLVVRARASGRIGAVASAWIVSAGLAWNAFGLALAPAPTTQTASPGCDDRQVIARLATLPVGTVIAPIDIGSRILVATQHRVLAAPYHRNGEGNRAAYDFFLGRPDAAQAVARRWRADYVLMCRDAFGGIDMKREGPGGMAILLARGTPPDWLAPLALGIDGVALYRVLPVTARAD